MEKKGKLRIGTSGWSYRHWLGVFYPEDLKPAKFLEFYTQHFDCVELNASFYRLPNEKTVESWVKRTPPEFRFCLKLSRLITHQKHLVAVEDPLETFFDRFRPLEEAQKLGPLLVQLPPSLRFDAAVVEDFFALLSRRHSEHRFALEVRHGSWFADEALEMLERHRIAFVIAHSGGRFPYHEAVTTDFVYLRFHGPGELYASNYPDEMLREYAEKIANWQREGLDVWVFFNNDVGGYAVENAVRLRGLIQASSLSN
jgi:uncharacterized protein YecE (DUF72 family)